MDMYPLISIPAGHALWHGVEQSFVVYSFIMRLVTEESEMIFLGHAFSHEPHPVHFFSSTMGNPAEPMDNAPKRQASTHVPSPKHPIEQAFVPPFKDAAARQSLTPS